MRCVIPILTAAGRMIVRVRHCPQYGFCPRAARGLGVARRLLGNLERTARAAGAVVPRLETNRALSEAIALYKRSGYVEVKASNAEPYAHHWFEKMLGKKTQNGRAQ